MLIGPHADKTYCVIDSRGGDQLKTHWFEVSIAQPSSQVESRRESLTTTPSSVSSASSPQCDSLPYYRQDDNMEEDHYTGSAIATGFWEIVYSW